MTDYYRVMREMVETIDRFSQEARYEQFGLGRFRHACAALLEVRPEGGDYEILLNGTKKATAALFQLVLEANVPACPAMPMAAVTVAVEHADGREPKYSEREAFAYRLADLETYVYHGLRRESAHAQKR